MIQDPSDVQHSAFDIDHSPRRGVPLMAMVYAAECVAAGLVRPAFIERIAPHVAAGILRLAAEIRDAATIKPRGRDPAASGEQ